jgi:hypothetical protein
VSIEDPTHELIFCSVSEPSHICRSFAIGSMSLLMSLDSAIMVSLKYLANVLSCFTEREHL